MLPLGILAIPLAIVITLVVIRAMDQRETDRMLAEVRARGEPITAEELDAFYQPPPRELDCTSLWLEAGEKLYSASRTDLGKRLPLIGEADSADLPAAGQPWPDLPVAEQFLDENAEAMRMLHDAARRGGAARYPCDFSWGPLMTLPHLDNLRCSARCLLIEAFVRAHHSDGVGTATSLSAALTVADSLENEPVGISHVSRLAIHGMAFEQLPKLMSVSPFADDDFAQMESRLLATDFRSGLKRALMEDRVSMILFWQSPKLLEMDALQFAVSQQKRNKEIRKYLSLSQAYLGAVDKPWPTLLRGRDDSNPTEVVFGDMSSTSLLELQSGTLNTCFESTGQVTAQTRMMALAVALERYRRANGNLPAKLAELAPRFVSEVPLDPYTGKSFRYDVHDGGYVLYTLAGKLSAAETDAETGAMKRLCFRWPPRPKPAPATVEGAAPMGGM